MYVCRQIARLQSLHLSRLVQSLAGICRGLNLLGLLCQVLALKILVVKLSVEVLVIVHPRAHHVRVLLVIVVSTRSLLAKCLDCARVEADVISGQCFVTPEDVLAPQVRVHTALVHRCIGLESLFNVQLVLLDGHLNVLRVGISCENSIEVTSHAILLVVEAFVVSATDRVNVLGHQFAQHAPKFRWSYNRSAQVFVTYL